MATQCFKPLKGRVYRKTRLDDCGAPVIGATSVVTHGFIKVAGSFDYEDGDEFFERDAWGDICLNELDCPSLRRLNLEVDECTIDPDGVEMTHGFREITSAGDAVGFFGSEGQNCNGFALEVWQKASGVDCDSDLWVYWLFPWVGNAKMKDFEIARARLELGYEAVTLGSGSQVGTLGPYDTLPAGNALAAGDHFAVFLSSEAPPTEACGATAYAAPV